MPLSDQQYQQYVAYLQQMGQLSDEEKLNALSQARAKALRTPAPGGRQVGSVYVAGSPLEHLAHGVTGAVSGYRQNKAEENYRDILARRRQTPLPSFATPGFNPDAPNPMPPDLLAGGV